jgi:glycosyltransferase involved in cell wall biosynthesis
MAVRVLIVADHYLPSYKAGGPVRSISNIVEFLGDEFEFRIVTSDRDLGDEKPFDNIASGEWEQVGKARVLYLSPEQTRLTSWNELLNREVYDVLYLNSFFSTLTVMTLFLRRLGKIPQKPILIAVRGELGQGALSIKRFKKRVYLLLTKTIGFFEGIKWHASSEYELADLLCTLGISRKSAYISRHLFVAPDLPRRRGMLDRHKPSKEKGVVRIVFLSRISRKKNLDVALQLLMHVKGEIEFDIYGPVEDEGYWKECQLLIKKAPKEMTIKYRGPVPPEEVEAVFGKYHLFLFPTRNENFGHVILEALCAGCLVLTSDATAWRGLESKKVGWDLSLNNPDGFQRALDEIVAMEDDEFEARSFGARDFGHKFANNPELVNVNRNMFLSVINGAK